MAIGSPFVSCDAAVAPSQRGELQRPAERHRKILGVATDAADLRGSTPTPKPKRRRRDQFQRGLGSLLQGKTMAVGIEVVSPDASWFLKTSVTSVFDFLIQFVMYLGFWCLLQSCFRFYSGAFSLHRWGFQNWQTWHRTAFLTVPPSGHVNCRHMVKLALAAGLFWRMAVEERAEKKEKTAGTGMPFPQFRGWLEDGLRHHAPSYYRTL